MKDNNALYAYKVALLVSLIIIPLLAASLFKSVAVAYSIGGFIFILFCILYSNGDFITFLISSGKQRDYVMTAKLAEMNLLLEKKNLEIIDSIKYARLIQDSIFANNQNLKKLFPESFFHYSAHDLLSSSLLAIESKNRKMFSVFNYTGHSVPGALMTLNMDLVFRNALMNIVLHNQENPQPDEILNQLDKEISLGSSEFIKQSWVNDEIEIFFCILDTQRRKLQISSSTDSLYFVHNRKLSRVEGLQHSGIYLGERIHRFKRSEFTVQDNDCFYYVSKASYVMETKIKKTSVVDIEDFLLNIQDKTMDEQNKTIERTIHDIGMIGIKM